MVSVVSFDTLVFRDTSPIYLQICNHIKAGIVAETIKNGEELPSRRQVSALLGVNPNTIQKAYKQLEEEGFIHSQPGAKSVISITENQVKQVKIDLVEADLVEFIRHLQSFGIKKAQALTLLDKLWEVEI